MELFGGAYKTTDGGATWQKKKADGTYEAWTPTGASSSLDDVVDAINDYIAVFNSFWAESVADFTTATASVADYKTTVETEMVKTSPDKNKISTKKTAIQTAVNNAFDAANGGKGKKLNPKKYTAATFKPYGDEEPIVTFDASDLIETTDAMKAILTAVDPYSASADNNAQWDGDTFEAQTAIFKGSATDFWKACKAEYDYWVLTNTKVKDNLKEIKDWIDAVEAAFVADAEQAGEDDPDAFAAWQEDYKAATALVDSIANYNNALKDFTGVDADGNANGIFTPVLDYSTLDKFFNQTTEALTFVLAERSSLFDEFTGKWAEKLGGKQLELAKVLFPEAPAELMEWEYAYAEINDDMAHADILYNSFQDAYMAAAKAAEYTSKDYTGSKIDSVYNELQAKLDAYIELLDGKIKKDNSTITQNTKKIAEFWSEVPVIDIAIAEAEQELETVKTKLQAAVTALDYATANLQRVMDYMKSLDANFLNGSELDFPWNATTTTGGSTTGGSTTGGTSPWSGFPWTI